MVESPPACKKDVISNGKVVFFLCFQTQKDEKDSKVRNFSRRHYLFATHLIKVLIRLVFLGCLHESAHIIKIFNITKHYSRNLLPDKILLFGNINLYFPAPTYYDHYLQSFEVRNLQNYSRISCLIHIWSLNVDHSF